MAISEKLIEQFEKEPNFYFYSVEGEVGYPIDLVNITPEDAQHYLDAYHEYCEEAARYPEESMVPESL